MEQTATTAGLRAKTLECVDFTKQLLLNPAQIFRNLSKTGGYSDPLMRIVSMGLLAGIVKIFVTFFYMINGASVGLFTALSAVLFVPITLIAFCYGGSFLLFIAMKALGADSEIETAFRVCAQISGIAPIAVIALAIPYAGNLIMLALLAYLLITAAIEVYQLSSNTAWMIFGISCVLLAILSLGSEFRNRHQATSAEPAPATLVCPALQPDAH
ncbi:MAG: hypothetical protein JXR59_03865 [Desulfuromonadaceae bacterium]|nr:hypothetical protein [Desulfuromonadaceae bacterium]